MLYLASSYRLLPEDPGVYIYLNKSSKVLYVGKARNLRKRVASYFQQKDLGPRTKMLVSEINKIRVIPVNSEIESLLLEANYIKKYTPKYNVKLTDGKAYPLIRVTAKEKCPKVLTARRMDDKDSLYFGPYPNVGAMRTVLKILRRIFPYESTKNHPNKVCLYYHIGLCPCAEVYGNTEYKRNIRRIIKFLSGETKTVLKDLKKERDLESKNENYEKASMIQKRIDAIELITSPFYRPLEYELNANLKSDIRRNELTQLKNILNKNGQTIGNIVRIECFDISNIQGSLVTGSMVTFVDGDADKSSYRRFKIRSEVKGKPNDCQAMEEVLKRRIKHTEWEVPDLIMVDGGKGQVSSALKEIKNIPIIGLAKKEETIITSNLKEIKLERNNPALNLIMRIRDEAHRFAITYHRKLRSKEIFK